MTKLILFYIICCSVCIAETSAQHAYFPSKGIISFEKEVYLRARIREMANQTDGRNRVAISMTSPKRTPRCSPCVLTRMKHSCFPPKKPKQHQTTLLLVELPGTGAAIEIVIVEMAPPIFVNQPGPENIKYITRTSSTVSVNSKSI